MNKVKRFVRLHFLGLFMSVRVYDNFVDNYLPALTLKNKVRYILGMWIPIGKDSPFSRYCDIKSMNTVKNMSSHRFDRLRDMGKEFNNKFGELCIDTHWRENKRG